MSLTKANHDEFVDILKGIAIVLVVIGHSISAVDSLCPFFNFIYSFHMPLFFFLSGYVEEKGRSKYAHKKYAMLLKRGKSLLIPYIAWTIIFHFFRNSPGNIHMQTLLSRLCGYEQDCMWFLAVLYILKSFHFLLWLLTEQLAKLLFFKERQLICLMLSLLTVESIIILLAIASRQPFLINAVTYAIPYFAGMSIVRSSLLRKIFENKFTVLGCMICYIFLFPCFSMHNPAKMMQIIRIILSLCIIVSLFAARKLILKIAPSAFFQLLGRNSLEIYLLHTFTIDYFTFIYQIPASQMLLTVLSVCAAVIVSFASLLLSWILCKIPFAAKILFGK